MRENIAKRVPDSERTLTSSAVGSLPVCIADARRAVADSDRGPPDPTNYVNLRGRLGALRETLPPLYRESFYDPYVATLNGLGPSGFQQILLTDPDTSLLMLDAAHAILQNGEGFQKLALDAFQEVVSDLYDGFLSAEDRAAVRPPDRGIIPPLVKFGNPQFGPYTFPIEATSSFRLSTAKGLGSAIVNLPPANARQGLLAWASLGHETGGHDILSADIGLKSEIMALVRRRLRDAGLRKLATYWANRIDETASDVLGILNMGPAAGIGLVGFFRAFSSQSRLRNVGPASDSHPADILRRFLAAETVRLLSFADAARWADIIAGETRADLDAANGRIVLEGEDIPAEQAIQSAQLVASTIATSELTRLEGTSFIEIQDWRNRDEELVVRLRTVLTESTPVPSKWEEGVYAAHAVAAAVTAAVSGAGEVGHVFQRMLAVLKSMHDANPSFGPLLIAHPGDVKPDFVYVAA